jgi:hypothetical protein
MSRGLVKRAKQTMKIVGKYRKVCAGMLLLAGGWFTLSGQSDLPQKPLLEYVTVSTLNNVTLYWYPSSSEKIRTYKIYSLDLSGSRPEGTPIDSVDANTLSYTHAMEKFTPLIYTITAIDSAGNESLLEGNYHQPVKLTTRYDSCFQQMELSWNSYTGWDDQIAGYRVIIDDTCDCSEDVLLDPGKLTFTHEGISENAEYSYRVVAFHNQGMESYSNLSTRFTYMPPPPEFINLDYVSVVDDYSVEISFTADVSGEVNDFIIMKSGSPESEFTGWQVFPDLSDTPVVIHDDFPTMGQQLFYRVDALNSCGKSIFTSNIAANILLKGTVDGTTANLQWTPYKGFKGSMVGYTVYRNNPYDEYVPVANLSYEVTSFSEDIGTIGSGNQKGEVSYFIEALEAGDNPHGVTGISRSNDVTLGVESHLWMPNAFRPGSTWDINRTFKPVMDFIPENFLMVIYDRSGKKLFESRDPLTGWDGTTGRNGMASQGVYIYHIEYTSYTGVKNQKTGTVTVVHP